MAAQAWDNPSIADSLKLGLPLQLPPLLLPSICSGQSFAVCTAVRFQQLFFSPKENIGLVSNSPRPDRKLIAAWPFRTRPLGNSPPSPSGLARISPFVEDDHFRISLS